MSCLVDTGPEAETPKHYRKSATDFYPLNTSLPFTDDGNKKAEQKETIFVFQ